MDVDAAVAAAHRDGWALVLAATARVARDLDLAEECVQEAYAAALTSWARDGIPDNPAAWLTTTPSAARWTPYVVSGSCGRSCRCWSNPRMPSWINRPNRSRIRWSPTSGCG